MHFPNSSRYVPENMKRDRMMLILLTAVGLCFLIFVICVIVVVNNVHSRHSMSQDDQHRQQSSETTENEQTVEETLPSNQKLIGSENKILISTGDVTTKCPPGGCSLVKP
ncbi:uncharacterized protein [Ptychodera flava]|uniref:uncharacterized protein n=1 Tax=Ptychodera flava TaxID=63121 RepID=UPI003969CF40